MSIQPRSVWATCLTRPPTLSALRVGVALRLLLGESVGGDPQHVPLLVEVGEQSVTLVADGGNLSGHADIIAT